jgi:anti-sigma regulatory factor (Ser/Thr protein kinase)
MAPLDNILEWGMAGAPLAGEDSSGDLGLIEPFDGGALVALIDGLGHGPEAAAAADAAARLLRREPSQRVQVLIQHCHEGMRRTRGAAISLASFDAASASIEWIGIGNVDGILVRATEQTPYPDDGLMNRGGTVGFRLPPLQPRTLPVRRGDTLVLATDGIRGPLRDEVAPDRAPQDIADAILARHARATDDACVVVARYVGDPVDDPSHRPGAVRRGPAEPCLVDDELAVLIVDESDVVIARMLTRRLAHRLGFAEAAADGLATAVSEVARNSLVHAGRGELRVRTACEGGRRGIIAVSRDRGPGIRDLELALRDGYSTGAGLGLGLPGARRLVDEFDLSSAEGGGTTVVLKKWLR